MWNCERPDALRKLKVAGFSGALSHFVYVESARTLFDLGEGVATRLDPKLHGVWNAFLSHVHDDHLLGLRALALELALHPRIEFGFEIYVPAPSMNLIEEDLNWFSSMSGFEWRRGFRLLPIAAGTRMLLHNSRHLEAFDADHLPNGASLGFRLLERRHRLQARWQHLAPQEVAALRRELPTEEVLEDFDVVDFVYSGDTPLCPAPFAQGAKILWHEANFLAAKDRNLEVGRHAVLEDVVRLAKDREVENLVLTHVSRRYRDGDVCAAIEQTLSEVGYDKPTFWLRGSFDLPVD